MVCIARIYPRTVHLRCNISSTFFRKSDWFVIVVYNLNLNVIITLQTMSNSHQIVHSLSITKYRLKVANEEISVKI